MIKWNCICGHSSVSHEGALGKCAADDCRCFAFRGAPKQSHMEITPAKGALEEATNRFAVRYYDQCVQNVIEFYERPLITQRVQ